jgi:hypothetical protein
LGEYIINTFGLNFGIGFREEFSATAAFGQKARSNLLPTAVAQSQTRRSQRSRNKRAQNQQTSRRQQRNRTTDFHTRISPTDASHDAIRSSCASTFALGRDY